MSRPCASVPNTNWVPGGICAFIRFAYMKGCVCDSHEVRRQTIMVIPSTKPPIIRLLSSYMRKPRGVDRMAPRRSAYAPARLDDGAIQGNNMKSSLRAPQRERWLVVSALG